MCGTEGACVGGGEGGLGGPKIQGDVAEEAKKV